MPAPSESSIFFLTVATEYEGLFHFNEIRRWEDLI